MIKRGYFKDFVSFFCLKFFKVWDSNDKESFHSICLEPTLRSDRFLKLKILDLQFVI